MNHAKFRALREYLGFSSEEMAGLLGVTSRQLRRWEAGTSPIPDGVAEELVGRVDHADNEVDRIVDLTMDSPNPVFVTFRTNERFTQEQEALPGHTAAWHRRIVARASRRVPGLGIVYAEDLPGI